MVSDPAKGRYFTMQFVRAIGVALVLVGILHQAGRIEALRGVPAWGGYVIALIGLVGSFAAPKLLARRWKTRP